MRAVRWVAPVLTAALAALAALAYLALANLAALDSDVSPDLELELPRGPVPEVP